MSPEALNALHGQEHPDRAGIQSGEERFSFPHLDSQWRERESLQPSRETT